MNDAFGMPQTAVVIGGGSDIARAVLRRLVARRLRRIVLAGPHPDKLKAVAADLEALGAEAVTCIDFDVTDVAAADGVADACADALGRIDLVLVAAGVLGDQATAETDPAATAAVLTTNLTGPAAVLVAFAGRLRRQGSGRLVVITSVAGVRVRRANFVYGASKAGLDGFAQGLGDALVGSGVTLTIVRPGWVATAMTAGLPPGPLATTADAVAADVVRGLERGAEAVWSPAPLQLLFAGLRLLPRRLWRRMPA